MLARAFHFACFATPDHRVIRSTREVTNAIPKCVTCGATMTPIRTEERNALEKLAKMMRADTPEGNEAFWPVWHAFRNAVREPANFTRRLQIANELADERNEQIADLHDAVAVRDRVNGAIHRMADAISRVGNAFAEASDAMIALKREIETHDAAKLGRLGHVADQSIVHSAERLIADTVDAGLRLIGISEPAPAAGARDLDEKSDRVAPGG